MSSSEVLRPPLVGHVILPSGRPRLEDERCHPLFSIGFRPFFLGAALVALLWVPLWLAMLYGLQLRSSFPPVLLHAHEMLFGFGMAVIAGFLLTAGANWIGKPVTTGRSLKVLFGVWILGRLAFWLPGLPPWLVACLDLPFVPLLGGLLTVRFVAAGSQRNFQFLGMLAVLLGANVLMHLEAVGVRELRAGLGTELALRTVTFMMLVMGGRVIPLFTKNAVGKPEIQARPLLEKAGLASFVVASLVDLFEGARVVVALCWLATGNLNLVRMGSWGTRWARAPLLLVLHAGFFAVALSLVLEGLTVAGGVPHSAATHVLTIGGIGGLCLGMMTRVSLGHSGRILVAPSSMTLSFALLGLAALTRSLGAVFAPNPLEAYVVAGSAWTLAFAIFLRFGLPIWLTPRLHGPSVGLHGAPPPQQTGSTKSAGSAFLHGLRSL